MSELSISQKTEIIRQESNLYANTRGRVADVLDDINATKANKRDLSDANTTLSAEIASVASSVSRESSARQEADALKLDKLRAPYNTDQFVILGDGSALHINNIGQNIYNTNGSLSSDRIMDLGSYSLLYTNNGKTAKVGINVTSASESLDVGGRVRSDGFMLRSTSAGSSVPRNLRADAHRLWWMGDSGLDRPLMFKDFTDLMDLTRSLTDEQKTEFKTALNGGWTTAEMSVVQISPRVIPADAGAPLWIVLRGSNLNIFPLNSAIVICDNWGNYLDEVPMSDVQIDPSGNKITFSYDFSNNLGEGDYKIKINNGIAEHLTAQRISVSNSYESLYPEEMSWEMTLYEEDFKPSRIYASGASVITSTEEDMIPMRDDGVLIASMQTPPLIPSDTDFYLKMSIDCTGGGAFLGRSYFNLLAMSGETPNTLNRRGFGTIESRVDGWRLPNGANGANIKTLLDGQTIFEQWADDALEVEIHRESNLYTIAVIKKATQECRISQFIGTTAELALLIQCTNRGEAYENAYYINNLITF